VFWFEEPLHPDDIEGFAHISQALDISVACGELESGRHRFKELMDAKSVDIVQPDVSVCGGISEWIKIAAVADAYRIPVAPHSLHDIHMHLASATPNCIFVEFFDRNADLTKYSELYNGYTEPHNGFLRMNDRPGLGIEPNWDFIDKHKVVW
jgi:D-arabinonate dehydratase